MLYQKGNKGFAISIKKINEALDINYLSAKSEQKKEDQTNSLETLKRLVPDEYYKYLNVFNTKKADKLPPYRLYDYKITLKENMQPEYCLLYKMSTEELITVKSYLKKNLKKGFIQPSLSPFASPVLFVKK